MLLKSRILLIVCRSDNFLNLFLSARAHTCCKVLQHVLRATELLRQGVACNMSVVGGLDCGWHFHDYGSMIIQDAFNIESTFIVFHYAAAYG